jgi:hypothetical protein
LAAAFVLVIGLATAARVEHAGENSFNILRTFVNGRIVMTMAAPKPQASNQHPEGKVALGKTPAGTERGGPIKIRIKVRTYPRRSIFGGSELVLLLGQTAHVPTRVMFFQVREVEVIGVDERGVYEMDNARGNNGDKVRPLSITSLVPRVSIDIPPLHLRCTEPAGKGKESGPGSNDSTSARGLFQVIMFHKGITADPITPIKR